MVKLFFSYSHKDEELRNELETHLTLLKRQRVISSWHDRRITAGTDVNQSIDTELEASKVILLLVSANFLASDYCYEREMKRALEKHENGTAVVIPVILHPCDWHPAPFGHLRATPTDGKPISMYANQHEAFTLVAKDVRNAVGALKVSGSTSVSMCDDLCAVKPIVDVTRTSNLRIKRKFDDHERDEFLENGYEYIARFFDGSLKELSARNSQIKIRFKRQDQTSFTASIYDDGRRVSQCSIWYGTGILGSPGIAYSHSDSASKNGYNELFSVVDEGYSLHLKPLGMRMSGHPTEALTQQGAAEYFWDMFIQPLQV